MNSEKQEEGEEMTRMTVGGECEAALEADTKRVVSELVRKIDIAIEEAAPERDYAGTPYIPIFVMLPLGTISMENKVAEPEKMKLDLVALKNAGVDGVMVDCWWGIVEGKAPKHYDWSGYHHLFNIVREAKLKLQVVTSFHQCGGNVGDDVYIPLPQWVLEIGRSSPDIFYRNRAGAQNLECLTWGIDTLPVLQGRTALEVYHDYMKSLRTELNEFFEDDTIQEVEVGMGPCGELRYPSYAETEGWRYPGTGEFQCYDSYLMMSLKEAAQAQGHPEWAVGPSDAGHYNSMPQDSDFFKDGGGYDSPYGKFFLKWYSQTLIEHGDRVLTVAECALEGVKLAAKVSGIHWWYNTGSHAAELAAGFYNQASRCGYDPIATMLAKHKATFNFTCIELRTDEQTASFPEAKADPESLVRQVLNAAWATGIPVACENALSCYGRRDYNQILLSAKPKSANGDHLLVAFTYLRLNPQLMEEKHFNEFTRFVKRLHGI